MKRYFFENNSSNTIVVTEQGDNIGIAVLEEKAMDSYNADFECAIHLPRHEVVKLIAFLEAALWPEEPL
jgi:hypothetical protein